MQEDIAAYATQAGVDRPIHLHGIVLRRPVVIPHRSPHGAASCSIRDLCRLWLEIMKIVDSPLGMGRGGEDESLLVAEDFK